MLAQGDKVGVAAFHQGTFQVQQPVARQVVAAEGGAVHGNGAGAVVGEIRGNPLFQSCRRRDDFKDAAHGIGLKRRFIRGVFSSSATASANWSVE